MEGDPPLRQSLLGRFTGNDLIAIGQRFLAAQPMPTETADDVIARIESDSKNRQRLAIGINLLTQHLVSHNLRIEDIESLAVWDIIGGGTRVDTHLKRSPQNPK